MNKYFGLLSVVLFGLMSPVLSAAPVPAEKLFQSPNINIPDLSPDGRYVSYLARFNEGTYLALQSTSSKALEGVLVLDDDERVRGYAWLDSHTILVNVEIDRSSKLLVVFSDPAAENGTWDNRLLNVEGYLLTTLPDEPGYVLMALKNRSSDTPLIYRIPVEALRQGSAVGQYEITGVPRQYDWFAYSDDLARLVALEIDADNEQLYFFIGALDDFGNANRYQLKLEEWDFIPVGQLSEQTMAVLTNKDTDTMSLFEFDLPTQTFGKLLYSHSMFDLVDADVSAKTGKVISVSYYQHGKLTSEFLDEQEKDNSNRLKQEFGENQTRVVAENKGTGQQVLNVFSSANPGTYYLYDSTRDVIEKLLPLYEDLQGYSFEKTRLIQTQSQDGSPIDAYLTIPSSSSHNTLLVMPHGGPVGVMDTVDFDPTVHYFVSRGFSVLKVNYRGSAGYGTEFREAGVGQWGKMIEEDITAALNAAMAQHNYEHICAIGGSYGAYSSMMLALKHPDDVECVIGAFGVYDLPLMFNSSNLAVLDEVREGWTNTIGELDDALFDVSPVYLAKDINVPVLLFGGVKDDITTVEHTRRMEYVLQRHNKDVQAVYYKHAGHGHSNWYGDWHQHTMSYHFLLETLGLPALNIDSIAEKDKPMIRKEYTRVAATFDNDRWLNGNKQTALNFYRLAADMGSADGYFGVGWYYEHSDIVDKDTEKALTMYRKASEQGDSSGSFVLGNHYYSGKYVTEDKAMAMTMYELARDQKHNAMVNVMLARGYCLGHGVTRDEAKCVELMDLEQQAKDIDGLPVNDSSYARRRSVLAEVLMSDDLAESGRRALHQKMMNWYQLDKLDVKADIDVFGRSTFGDDGLSYDGSATVRLLEEGTFGAALDIQTDNAFRSSRDMTMIVIRWRMHYADETFEDKFTNLLWGNEKSNWFARLSDEDVDENATSVELQVFDVNRNPLAAQRFIIQRD